MNRKMLIGLVGLQLTDKEREWLQSTPPLGVILFARNIQSPEQVRALLNEVRDIAGKEIWAAIDEEGGRVNRLPWSPFIHRKHAAEYGAMFMHDETDVKKQVFDDAYEVGLALKDLCFTHNCAPVLDLYCEQGNAIIGKRAYSHEPHIVAELAIASMQGLQEAGIQAVGKHFPGHGRANADSHVAVPTVDAGLDTLLSEAAAFERLIVENLNHIMTAHVVYTDVEGCVATFSSFWLQNILREKFSFAGKIWSDDMSMKGAGENITEALNKADDAGCDVLLVCDPVNVAEIYASEIDAIKR